MPEVEVKTIFERLSQLLVTGGKPGDWQLRQILL